MNQCNGKKRYKKSKEIKSDNFEYRKVGRGITLWVAKKGYKSNIAIAILENEPN